MSSQSYFGPSTTTSVPADAASTYSYATSTYTDDKTPIVTSSSKPTKSQKSQAFKAKTKKFFASLGQPPTAEYDRLHPKVLTEQEKEAKKFDYPVGMYSSQIRGVL